MKGKLQYGKIVASAIQTNKKYVAKAICTFLSVLLYTCTKCQPNKFNLFIGSNVSVDNFRWSIAGNIDGKSPNILSELNYSNITSVGGYVEGNYSFKKLFNLDVSFNKNYTVKGSGIDVDYADDNRTNVTNKKLFTSNSGGFKKMKIGVSHVFNIGNSLSLSMGSGYLINNQLYYIKRNDIPNLNTTYDAIFKGLYINGGIVSTVSEKINYEANLTYIVSKYHANANWNMISQFMHPLSFEQHSNGNGVEAMCRFKYQINQLLGTYISNNIGIYNAFGGIDKAYMKNNSIITTKFNGATNKFYDFQLGLYVAL